MINWANGFGQCGLERDQQFLNTEVWSTENYTLDGVQTNEFKLSNIFYPTFFLPSHNFASSVIVGQLYQLDYILNSKLVI